jgi:uncharacterized protein (DUF362 family)/Pyruvate/2-oxoacid:ferredoxin oxidoreductase delta subunit
VSKKSTVAVVYCDSYEQEKVFQALKRAVDLIGGAGAVVRRGERVLLKPNVLAGVPPERCATTHPSVLKAAGRVFGEIGARLFYGDSPGFGQPAAQMKKAGLADAAEELGIEPADFDNGKTVSFEGSPFTRRFVLAQGVLDSDCLISLAKFKTHQLTRITGAVKNQFGCIPGLLKPEYHVKMSDPHDFSRMLVALTLFLGPRLYVLDAISAMEGNGPRSGDPVKLNALLVSRDPVALDATGCRIVNLEPAYVPTMEPGKEWGLGVYDSAEIELVGDPIEQFFYPDFSVERSPVRHDGEKGALSWLKQLVSARPAIDKKRCVRCGVCVDTCPVNPKAIDWVGKAGKRPPVYTYRRCIRCFCCQELCPERAIYVKTPPVGRMVFGRTD